MKLIRSFLCTLQALLLLGFKVEEAVKVIYLTAIYPFTHVTEDMALNFCHSDSCFYFLIIVFLEFLSDEAIYINDFYCAFVICVVFFYFLFG